MHSWQVGHDIRNTISGPVDPRRVAANDGARPSLVRWLSTLKCMLKQDGGGGERRPDFRVLPRRSEGQKLVDQGGSPVSLQPSAQQLKVGAKRACSSGKTRSGHRQNLGPSHVVFKVNHASSIRGTRREYRKEERKKERNARTDAVSASLAPVGGEVADKVLPA